MKEPAASAASAHDAVTSRGPSEPGNQASPSRAAPPSLFFDTVADTAEQLEMQGYVADDALSTSLFLATRMGRPLLLEGAPGVGKTELAKAVGQALSTDLIRLQCYEGLELSQAAYEWNHLRQLLEVQVRTAGEASGPREFTRDLFDESYLLRRPLLEAIDPARTRAPVLLIDELDRADEEFESFLLELLSDFQITIPELGTIRARYRPIVIVTSNRTREVHDALKRRCLYQWIDYPGPASELRILQRKVPGLSQRLGAQVVDICQRLRRADLFKVPGVAESIDWAWALRELGVERLDEAGLQQTVGCALKHRDDVARVREGLGRELLDAAASGA